MRIPEPLLFLSANEVNNAGSSPEMFERNEVFDRFGPPNDCCRILYLCHTQNEQGLAWMSSFHALANRSALGVLFYFRDPFRRLESGRLWCSQLRADNKEHRDVSRFIRVNVRFNATNRSVSGRYRCPYYLICYKYPRMSYVRPVSAVG